MFLQTDPNYKNLKKNRTHVYYCLTHKHIASYVRTNRDLSKKLFLLFLLTLFNLFFFRM